jgi:RNA polymerase sigma factor (TIGR02999 family)
VTEATQLLEAIGRGDPQAADRLLPLVYEELRRLAAAQLAAERPGQTLDATALVHEAYLRLVGSSPDADASALRWDSRGHFFAAAAQAMRRILINNARRKQRLKHGGGRERVPLEQVEPVEQLPDQDLLDLDEALRQFAVAAPQKAKLVELRYFAGLSAEDAARCLSISRATADRWWTYSRAWLHDFVRRGNHPAGE